MGPRDRVRGDAVAHWPAGASRPAARAGGGRLAWHPRPRRPAASQPLAGARALRVDARRGDMGRRRRAGRERRRRPPARRARGSRSGGPLAGAVSVAAIVAALGPQVRRQREWVTGLRVTAELLQRTPQAEERVVVGRCVLDDRLELLAGLLVALRAEQRPAESLADRVLAGLEIAGPGQRDDGGVEVALRQEL